MKLNKELFKVKRLSKKDVVLARQLILLFQDIFEMKKGKSLHKTHLKELLKKPNFIAFVITHKKAVIGGLTAYELPMVYSDSSEMFIYDMAIKPDFQRMGLGKLLISALQQYCKENGIKEIFVAANAEDKHALKFYHSAKGKAEKVVHFAF